MLVIDNRCYSLVCTVSVTCSVSQESLRGKAAVDFFTIICYVLEAVWALSRPWRGGELLGQFVKSP